MGEPANDLTPEQIAERQSRKNATIFSQEAVDYTPLSPALGQACANCIFYRSTGYDGVDWPHCHIVSDWPKPIEPTGWCKEWRLIPEPDMSVDPIPVMIVEPEADDKAAKGGLIETIKTTVQNILNPETPAFQVFKTQNGRKGWVARHTGKFKDRHKEILADSSHDEYVARVQGGQVQPPELWMWHNKGCKHGNALTVWKSGGFVLAVGLFDQTEEGDSAFDYYQKHAGQITLSHMFHYPAIAKVNGVYWAYNTVEISTLPDGAEAFPYTSFEEIETMTLPEPAQIMIREALGEEALRRALAADAKAAKDTQKLEEAGVAWKGYDNYDGSAFLTEVQKVVSAAAESVDTRLKTAEEALKTLAELPATVKTLNDTVKALEEQLTASQTRENALMERTADLEKQLAEYHDVQPPASQSKDTILQDREKSLLEKAMEQSKSLDSLSLVEKVVGGQPALSSTNGGNEQ